MAVKTLGKVTVTTSGTPVQCTTSRLGAQSILVQANPTNTGKIYVGNSALVASTLVGCFAVLPVPTTSSIPSVTFTIVNAPAGLDLKDFWIDAAVNGESAIVSYTEQ